MLLAAAPWENPPGRSLPTVTQVCSWPDLAPREGRQGTAKSRNTIPGTCTPCQRGGRDGVPLPRHPRVPCGEGRRPGPEAGHGAGGGQQEKGSQVGSPSPRSASGTWGSEGRAGDAVRVQRLQVVGHGPSAGGATAQTRSFLPDRAPPAQGQSGPAVEGPCPEPHKHPNQLRGVGVGGLFSTAACWRCRGTALPARISTCVHIRCHLHPDECCHVRLPQLLRQGIPEGQSQWSRILPSPSHRHPAPIGSSGNLSSDRETGQGETRPRPQRGRELPSGVRCPGQSRGLRLAAGLGHAALSGPTSRIKALQDSLAVSSRAVNNC